MSKDVVDMVLSLKASKAEEGRELLCKRGERGIEQMDRTQQNEVSSPKESLEKK